MSHRIRPNPSALLRRASRAALERVEPRRLMASVSGIVYADANGNGVRDAAEAPVANVVVFGDRNYNRAIDAGEQTATTDANGRYTIANIPLDNVSTAFRVATSQPVTAPAGGAYSLRFASDYSKSDLDFGLQAPAATPGEIHLFPFRDQNNNGQYDPVDGVVQFADVWFDTNRNGVHDAGEATLPDDPPGHGEGGPYQTTYTAVVAPGTYHIAARLLDDTDAIADKSIDVTVASGQRVTAFFAIPSATPVQTAAVSGRVYNDQNADGKYEVGEVVYEGRTVFADYNFNGVVDTGEPTALTNSAGLYVLSGIRADGSSVAVRLVTGNDLKVLKPGGNAYFARYSPGNFRDGYDFNVASSQGGTVAGYVRGEDYDGYDGNNAGYAGAVVFLDLNGDGRLNANEPSVTTPASGYFQFDGVVGSSITVRVQRTTNSLSYLEQKQTVNVTAGQWSYAYFGVPVATQTFSVAPYYDTNGDFRPSAGDASPAIAEMWLDLDRDARHDPEEPLFAVVASATTNGFSPTTYSLLDDAGQPLPVRIGSYQIAFRLAGDSDAIADSLTQFNLQKQSPAPVLRPLLAAPPAFTGRAATVTGTVFSDANGNGVRDAGEPGLAGWLVYADLDYGNTFDPGEPIAITDANGNYTLTGVRSDNGSVAIRLISRPEVVGATPSSLSYASRFNGAVTVTGRNFGVLI